MSRPKTIALIAAAAVLLAAGAVLSQGLRFRHYIEYCRNVGVSLKEARKIYGPMTADNEWLMALVTEADRGNWDKVEELTEKDRHSQLGTYYRNICKARKGRLGEDLMSYYQPFDRGLFLPVMEGQTPFSIGCAGEVWWQLGELTLCEHATLLGLIFSPHQKGERFMRRLAAIQLANGEDAAAQKYLRQCRGPASKDWESRIPLRPRTDTILLTGQNRKALLNLLEANPGNTAAYEYLLCYDLLLKDLSTFIKDYDPSRIRSTLYDQGVLAWLASTNTLTPETAAAYRIPDRTLQDFFGYTEIYTSSKSPLSALRPRFGQTYWFYFHFARKNE